MTDFRFRQLLRDYQITGDPQISIEMFSMGQRLGFSLADYRDVGVGWMTVVENLWQLNDVFLDQDEMIKYKQYLYKHGWTDSIDRKGLFARAKGDWHPTWPLGRVSVYVGSLFPSPKLRDWGNPMRIAFWGADDTGRELDIGNVGEYTSTYGGILADTEDEVLIILEDIIRQLPSEVTIHNLALLGFYRA